MVVRRDSEVSVCLAGKLSSKQKRTLKLGVLCTGFGQGVAERGRHGNDLTWLQPPYEVKVFSNKHYGSESSILGCHYRGTLSTLALCNILLSLTSFTSPVDAGSLTLTWLSHL